MSTKTETILYLEDLLMDYLDLRYHMANFAGIEANLIVQGKLGKPEAIKLFQAAYGAIPGFREALISLAGLCEVESGNFSELIPQILEYRIKAHSVKGN